MNPPVENTEADHKPGISMYKQKTITIPTTHFLIFYKSDRTQPQVT